MNVALQVGWEAPPILLSSATAVTASASPSLCTIRRSSCSSPVAASCGSACSRTFKTWRVHFHSWTWTPFFQEIFSFSLPLQLPEPACIIYPLFQLLGLKRVAHHGGQHARDHCATRPPSHFLQRLAQTNPHCAIGGCSHGGSLKPAEERTWQQAFGRYKLGWQVQTRLAGPLLGRCWAACFRDSSNTLKSQCGHLQDLENSEDIQCA